MAGITLFCAFFGWFFKSLTQVIEVPEEEEDSKTQQPLLQRIKAARAQEWTQSDENLNHHHGKQQLVESTASNGSATANGSVLPLSDVLNIIPLNDTAGDVAKMSSSKSSGIAGGKSSLAIENTASNLLSSRGRTRSERRNTLTTRDEMMYSNLSLVVPPPNRSISSLNLAQGESGAAGAEAGIILSGNSVIDDYLNKGWTLVDEPRGFLAGFNLLLLKRPSFILLSISGFLCLVGFFIPFIYISDRAKLLGRIDKHFAMHTVCFWYHHFPLFFSSFRLLTGTVRFHSLEYRYRQYVRSRFLWLGVRQPTSECTGDEQFGVDCWRSGDYSFANYLQHLLHFNCLCGHFWFLSR